MHFQNNKKQKHGGETVHKSRAQKDLLPLSTTKGTGVAQASRTGGCGGGGGHHRFNYFINILRPRGPESLTRWLIKGYGIRGAVTLVTACDSGSARRPEI